jgi:hypothetical protein
MMIWSGSVFAQTATVVNFSPANLATNIQLTSDIIVEFDSEIPTSSDDLQAVGQSINGFPVDSLTINGISISADRKTATINVTHTPNTNFYWVVTGFPDVDDEILLSSIFVTSYTTGSSYDGFSISGAMNYESTFFFNFLGKQVEKAPTYSSWDIRNYLKKTSEISSTLNEEPDYTYYYEKSLILVIDNPHYIDNINEGPPAGVVGVTLGKSDGTYEIGGMKNGTYYIFVIVFDAEQDGLVGLGTYTLDDDEPSPIDINGSSVNDIDLTIYVFDFFIDGLTFAEAYVPVYEALSEEFADIQLYVAFGAEVLNELEDEFEEGGIAKVIHQYLNEELESASGNSFGWVMAMYSKQADSTIVAMLSPFGFGMFGIEQEDTTIPDFFNSNNGVTNVFVNSDAATATANANGGSTFTNTHSDLEIDIFYSIASNLEFYTDLEGITDPVWLITYTAYEPIDSNTPYFGAYINAITGAFIKEASPVSIDENNDVSPAAIKLSQNYPNPFNPSTQIQFELPQQSLINLSVYDVSGRKVSELANGVLPGGEHRYTFDASNLASGLYIYRLSVDGVSVTRKMTLIK